MCRLLYFHRFARHTAMHRSLLNVIGSARIASFYLSSVHAHGGKTDLRCPRRTRQSLHISAKHRAVINANVKMPKRANQCSKWFLVQWKIRAKYRLKLYYCTVITRMGGVARKTYSCCDPHFKLCVATWKHTVGATENVAASRQIIEILV